MRITVLCGGPSSEREVSLISGKAVAQGLLDAGHDVFVSDVSPDNLSGLDRPVDVVFPVLHGAFGEDGEIQKILETRGLLFVGSGSVASQLGMDKIAAKSRWKQAGLPTPKWQCVSAMLPVDAWTDPGICVVKAIDAGSSIDVNLCKTPADAQQAIDHLLCKYGQCMIEQFIDGPEITIGLLEGRALPPILIETSHEFFDFQAKYTKGGATHSFDLPLSEILLQRCMTLAERANEILGCRDLARVDLMIDGVTNEPYLLEINTIPGFTPVSLLPEAAAKIGISFSQLVDRLVQMAWGRNPIRGEVRLKQNSLVFAATRSL